MLSSLPLLSRSRQPGLQPDADLEELNDALHLLAEVFPNVRPEVFREMLQTLSRESRVQVVSEQLLRNGVKWIRGRWRFPAQETSSRILREVYEPKPANSTALGVKDKRGKTRDDIGGEALVPLEESFRAQSYKNAVYATLRQEFKSLSRSTIQGVLAEQNYSYTLSHPILTGLAAKTWRVSIGNLFSQLRKGGSNKSQADEEHYMMQWSPGSGVERGVRIPTLRATGDNELDVELHVTVLQPILDRRNTKLNAISLELALLLNEHEAEEAGATFECQVCFSDIAFESMAMCTSSQEGHVTCFMCIQRAMAEALYGQSWDLTIDHERGQLACIAPSDHACDGCIPRALAERAVRAGKAGEQMWEQFEKRISDESLRLNGAALIQCPFCDYCELDHIYLPSKPVWMLNTGSLLYSTGLLFLGFDVAMLVGVLSVVPFIFLILLGLPLTSIKPHVAIIAYLKELFTNALALRLRSCLLSHRFVCKKPECGRPSCLDCRKQWRDIHKCHDSATVSLRTTVEAARTAALKRTCPRCGVGFVKDSGCNKMVCVCGYAMCYVCREGLGEKKGGRLMLGDVENRDHGYQHFCQHFRPLGGRCSECDKCDLYKSDDEDEIVKRAGERAEREWRDRNEGAEEIRLAIDKEAPLDALVDWLSRFSLQGIVNWWVANVLVCKLVREVPTGDADMGI